MARPANGSARCCSRHSGMNGSFRKAVIRPMTFCGRRNSTNPSLIGESCANGPAHKLSAVLPGDTAAVRSDQDRSWMSGPEGLHGISNMTVVQRQCGDEIREVLRLAAYRGIDGPVDHFHLDRFLRIANHLGSRSSKLISETASRCDASREKLSCTRERTLHQQHEGPRGPTAAGSTRRPADPPADPSAPRPARSSDARQCAVACLAVVGFRT